MTSTRTGTVQLSLDVPLTPAELWSRISDVSRYGDWSPECIASRWAPGSSRAQVGSRFIGVNRFANGNVGETTCVITDYEPPASISWVVLDDSGSTDSPGSIWSYELNNGRAGHTVLRHSFEQGTGGSFLVTVAGDHEAYDGRLAQIRRNMSIALRAMIGDYYLEEIR
jgi:uncharacterized protein YndB with AHSA1/START domain